MADAKLPVVGMISSTYVYIGIGVAAWTANRHDNKQQVFTGVTEMGGAAGYLLQTILLWPLAIIGNLTGFMGAMPANPPTADGK